MRWKWREQQITNATHPKKRRKTLEFSAGEELWNRKYSFIYYRHYIDWISKQKSISDTQTAVTMIFTELSW